MPVHFTDWSLRWTHVLLHQDGVTAHINAQALVATGLIVLPRRPHAHAVGRVTSAFVDSPLPDCGSLIEHSAQVARDRVVHCHRYFLFPAIVLD